PERFGRMPMIALSVVVLPAPLRPSKVTTSPGRTSKETPCRTWLSPYHPSSPVTDKRGLAVALTSGCASAASAMTGSDIGFDHAWVLRHGFIVAFGKHLAARQHRDGVGQRCDDREIVLDHQDRAVGRDALD